MAENYTIETDIIYEGNGAVKEFPITFSFSNENEVVVYLNGELIRKGYSIDGNSVVFNTAPAEGDEIALAKAVVDTPKEEENTSGESSESGSNTVYDQASREHIKINAVPTKVKYSGNGEVTEFPTGFAFFENDNIVVYLNGVIIDGGYSVTGVGETDGGSVIFEEAPKEGDKIVILRKVAIERVTDFQEGGAFRAKNVNDELDRQTAFCQQIQEQIDRCVKVEVTEDQTPEELLAEVYGKLDSATEVAQDAIEAANQAQIAADNATSAVEEAEQQVADTKVYVDSAKADIDNTVALAKSDIESTKDSTIAVVASTSASAVATIEQTVAGGKQEINATIDEAQTSLSDTIAQAVEDVKAEATKAAEDAIQNAADEATQVATEQTIEYVENTAIPAISAVKDSAVSELESVLAADKSTLEGYVSSATNQASIASSKASEAAESARVAGEKVNQIDGIVDEVNAAVESNIEKARIWAEGEQAEVKPLGGELSSMGAADLAYAIANAPEDTPIDASGLFAMNVVKGPKGDKGDKGEDGKDGGGLEIGDVAFAVMGIDETKNLRRYLNGQVISQSQFVSFTNWVKERAKLYPHTVATEENWQAEVTNSKIGQCGKFVIDNTLGTIRLPKVVNINGLQDLALMGSIKAESLPNITGSFGNITSGNNNDPWGNGAFEVHKLFTSHQDGTMKYMKAADFNINASRSSSTYQDNAPVQQEAILYPYFIQVATGTEESVDVLREIELNNPFSLLDYKWSEYEITNASWLLSNGAFHSGATYVSVYELLLKIYNGTQTKDGVSVKLSTEDYEDTDFVLNTANTTFRLPIKVKLASGNAVVGNGMTLGLTNGTYNASLSGVSSNYQIYAGTNIYGQEIPNSTTAAGNSLSGVIGVTTDPTKSGIETSSSGLKLYFYVGETVQDANVIAASGVLSAVADGVRKSSATDRETVISWGMPDYSAGVSITTGYTCPSDGVIIGVHNLSDNGVRSLSINSIKLFETKTGASYLGGQSAGFEYQVSKGDVITFSNYASMIFYPLKGVK